MTSLELLTSWRARADEFEACGLASAAALQRKCVEELEGALRSEAQDVINLQEAARESGYSADHLSRLVNAGRLKNVGRKHAPRVRRRDLPKKPGYVAPQAGAKPPASPSLPASVRSAAATRITRRGA